MVVALTVEFSAEESLAGERGILLGLLFRFFGDHSSAC